MPRRRVNCRSLRRHYAVSAALRKNLGYDAVKDFAFLSTVSFFPFVVAVRTEHPAKSLAQLVEMSRQRELSFTSVGVGSTQHMVGELLGASSGGQFLHVPYRGGGAPVQAVIGGEVRRVTRGRVNSEGQTIELAFDFAPADREGRNQIVCTAEA